MIEPIYTPSDKVFVVCTGHSLKDFDFTLLKGQHVIAVKYAYKHVPDFDCIVAVDAYFYRNEHAILSQMDKTSYAIENYDPDPIWDDMGKLKIIFLKETGFGGIDYNPGYVRFGGNSGYTALNLAIQLGAKDIRLLGMDLGMERKEDCYFYPSDVVYKEKWLKHFDFMIGYFGQFIADLRPDIRVTNYSMISRIQGLPKKELTTVLDDN